MANFRIIQVTSAGFAWEIINLSNPWSLTNYSSAGIRDTSFTSGTVFSPNYSFGYMPQGGTAYSFGSTSAINSSDCYSWVPSSAYGTDPFYWYPWIMQETGFNDTTWSVGLNGTITANNPAEAVLITPALGRPPYFYWSTCGYGTGYAPQNRSIVNGVMYIYTPYWQAWNAIRSNIIQMLVYKGLIQSSSYFSTYQHYFPETAWHYSITANDYNKAKSCINAMGGGVPSVTSLSTPRTENYYYYLQYYLNQIT